MPPPTLGRPRLQGRRPTGRDRAAETDAERAVPVTKTTKNLDRLKAALAGLGGTWAVVVDGLSDRSAVKLANLAKTGRPVLAVTDSMRQQVGRFVKAEFERGKDFSAAVFTKAAGLAIKKFVLLRFKQQGNDVSWRPLSPEYRAWKRAKGLDPRIGVATGALLRALERATFTLVRR